MDRCALPSIGASLPTLDSLATLRRLEQAGIFITALDVEREWFQYHGLFRTLLQHKLHMLHKPAEIDVLTQRVSAWYASSATARTPSRLH